MDQTKCCFSVWFILYLGSPVRIYGENCPLWIVVMQACNGYSLICVPLYDTVGAGDVNYIIDHAEIDVVFIQDKKIKEES